MVLGRWQAQKTARMYLNESRAILTEMKLDPLERFLAPFRTFFHNSDPRNFETLEPLQGNRAASVKRGLGGRGNKHPSKRPASKRGKSWHVPWGLARARGVAHLVRGGRVSGYAPFLVWWTRKGGDTLELLWGIQHFSYCFLISDNLAAERTEKRCVLLFGLPPPGIKE